MFRTPPPYQSAQIVAAMAVTAVAAFCAGIAWGIHVETPWEVRMMDAARAEFKRCASGIHDGTLPFDKRVGSYALSQPLIDAGVSRVTRDGDVVLYLLSTQAIDCTRYIAYSALPNDSICRWLAERPMRLLRVQEIEPGWYLVNID